MIRKDMDESAIIPLLGPPSYIVPWEVQWQKGFVKGSHYYAYNLGSWPMAAYDSTFLWIHIDDNGKVICAEIGGF